MATDEGKSTTTSSTKKRTRTTEPQNHHHHHHHHLFPLIPLVWSATCSAHSFLSQNDLHLLPSQTLDLESKITSIIFSLTKLNSLLQTLDNPNNTQKALITSPPPPPLPLPPPSLYSSSSSSCWFQRFLSSATDQSDPRWVESFRMSKPSFTLLLQILAPSLLNSTSKIPPHYMLSTALFRLAHGTSFKSIGLRFGIDETSSSRAFYDVCKAVNDRLGKLFELSLHDLSRISLGFGWISLPNCFGVLGLSKFITESKNKADGNGDSAVMLQCLVDSEGRFLDVSAGWPSKMDPQTVLRHTKLFTRVQHSNEFLNGPSYRFPDNSSIPQYILGDSYYPLLPWLLTPYTISSNSENSAEVQAAFNTVHNRGMKLVGTAFRRVRATWKLLTMKWEDDSVESYPFVIVAGCLLLNFLLKCSEPLPPDENADDSSEQDEFAVCEEQGNEKAQRIRDTLALHLQLDMLKHQSHSTEHSVMLMKVIFSTLALQKTFRSFVS